jgi:hypothetical protein
MRKWNASMPRKKAPEGGADVVLAYRTSSGKRIELQATMSAADADMLMRSGITFMKNFGEVRKAEAASNENGQRGSGT